MTSSTFKAEVKERNPGEPCFVLINTDQPIGLNDKHVVLDLPAGTGIAETQQLANTLAGLRISVR